MRIRLAGGIVIDRSGKRITLDPTCNQDNVDLAIYSHAHLDHIRSIKHLVGSAVATEHTIRIAKERYSSSLEKASSLKYGKEEEISGIRLSLHPAGHVLGSAQIKIKLKDKDILYTGDLRPGGGLTTQPAEPISCEKLIIDSTYGCPKYKFPSREKVYERIIDWTEGKLKEGFNVLIGGYVLGKAQELTKLYNQAGITPLVHPKIYRINKLYEEFGVDLGEYVNSKSKEGTDIMSSSDFVCIAPTSRIKRRVLDGLKWLSGSAHISTAVATGWAVDKSTKYRYGCEKAFPLSSHADFEGLIDYVKKVNPEVVYTVHGFTNRLASEIRNRLGIRSKAIGLFEQKKIFDFS